MAGEMPGGSAAQEPVCNMLWLPPSPEAQNKQGTDFKKELPLWFLQIRHSLNDFICSTLEISALA